MSGWGGPRPGSGSRRGPRSMSDWEVEEMRALRRSGWSRASLAALYGVSERTVSRYAKGVRAGDGR